MNRFSVALSLLPLVLSPACRPGESPGSDKDSAPGIGTGLDCGGIACEDGFNGAFAPAFTVHGAYVFTADIDGAVSTCAGSLPLGGDFACDGELQLTRSGSALPDDEHSLPSFLIYQAGFSTLNLTVTRDGVEEASWSESPEWELYQPNGADCGPTCTVAGATLSWP